MLTALLLLSALQDGPKLSEPQILAKARTVAARLGMDSGDAQATYLPSPGGDRPPEYLVDLSPKAGPPKTTVLRLRAENGMLLSIFDSEGRARPIPGWSIRIAKVQARAKILQYARNNLGMPPDWQVSGGTFDGRGSGSWPRVAGLEFQERPFGYRYFLGGNSARIRIDPKSGRLRSWSLTDGTTVDRATPRLRPDEAAAIARKARAADRNETRPMERGPVQLGWAPPLNESGQPDRSAPQRLVYRVRFADEDRFVDANNERVIGTRRTR